MKTRLIGALSAEDAARLHRAFLDDLVAALSGAAFELRLAWALDGAAAGVPARDGELESIEGQLVEHGEIAWFPQQGEALGARLLSCFERLRADGFDRIAAVGSDHPELEAETVERALDALDSADVVFGPALDGGYYLVALSATRIPPELFEGIAWSTARVLEQSRERCRQLGLRVAMLAAAADVDTPDDLEALAGRLAGHAGRCPSTAAVLRELGAL